MDCLTQYIDHHAATRPNSIAVQGSEVQLTFSELKEKADHIAKYICGLDMPVGTAIGLDVTPTPLMLCGLLGIMKAGCYAVPIDPNYPEVRIAYMIEEASINYILSASSIHVVNASTLDICAILKSDVSDAYVESGAQKHLALCLYTSGSTGRPKGVLIEHKALVEQGESLQQRYQLDENDCVLLFALLNHVSGLEQVLISWITGARLVLREGEIWSPSEFISAIEYFKLTFVDLPTSYCDVLANAWSDMSGLDQIRSLKIIVIGGEEGAARIASKIYDLGLENMRLINVYGMTEITGSAICYELNLGRASERVVNHEGGKLPIGTPLPGRTILILDENLKEVSQGETGELFIGGIGIACGYVNRNEPSQSNFIQYPTNEGSQEVFYKTGDLAKYRSDGVIVYGGRLDRQVQVKGFRVELDEIENTLVKHEDIEDAAAVLGKGIRSDILAAYVTLRKDDARTVLGSQWDVDSDLADEQGIISEASERFKFKLAQKNIEWMEQEGIQLLRPGLDDVLNSKYVSRRSYRGFIQQKISFEDFSVFLSSAMQIRLENYPLPKYRYPSAFGLYPIQIFMYAKQDAIEDIPEGLYYYNPIEHRLYKTADYRLSARQFKDHEMDIFDQSGFALFLVENLKAIQPMYGKSLSMKFGYLEAGYLGQLLMTDAPEYDLGMCPIGQIEDAELLEKAIGLGDDKALLHSFLGGKISQQQKESLVYVGQSAKTAAQIKTELVAQLRVNLPKHMQPDSLVILDELPRLGNGKVDYKKLENYELQIESNNAYIPPKDELEKQLVEIWEYVLKISPLGINDDFAQMGGDSLAALSLVAEVEMRMGISLPVDSIVSLSSIASMAKVISSEQGLYTPLIRKYDTVLEEDVYKKLLSIVVGCKLPQVNKHSLIVCKNIKGKNPPLFWCFNSLDKESDILSKKLGKDQPLYALLSGVYVFDDMLHVDDISEHYVNEILNIQPEGPYHLGGNCHGGKIMCSIMRRLQARGKKVARLCIMEYFESSLYDYDGKLLLLYGNESHLQAYRPFSWGEENWREAFKVVPQVDWLPGRHGRYFEKSGINVLAEKILFWLNDKAVAKKWQAIFRMKS